MSAGELLGVALLSLRIGALAGLVILVPGVLAGRLLARGRFRGRALLRTVLLLPMVLPPAAVGLVLLQLFARHAPLGAGWERAFGAPFLLGPWAAVAAAAVMSFPLLVLGAERGFEAVPPRLEAVAASLGARPLDVLLRVALPIAWRGILHGWVFAFVRALGEFGATVLVAGRIPGRTETLSTAIYARIEDFRDGEALALSAVAFALALSITGAAELLLRRPAR